MKIRVVSLLHTVHLQVSVLVVPPDSAEWGVDAFQLILNAGLHRFVNLAIIGSLTSDPVSLFKWTEDVKNREVPDQGCEEDGDYVQTSNVALRPITTADAAGGGALLRLHVFFPL